MLQAIDLEILNKNIRHQRQLANDFLAFGFGNIQRQRFFAAIGREVIGRFFGVVATRVFQKRRPPITRVITRTGSLDLDYIGAHVGENLRRPRASKHAGEIENAEMGECDGGHMYSIAASTYKVAVKNKNVSNSPSPKYFSRTPSIGIERYTEVRIYAVVHRQSDTAPLALLYCKE